MMLVIGLLLRFCLVFLDFSFDVHNHISWAQDLWNRGFENFYYLPSTEVYASLFPNYPPFANLIFFLMHPLHLVVEAVSWWLNVHIPLFPSNIVFFVQSRLFVAASMKIPAILADIGIVWLLVRFVKKIAGKKTQKKLCLLLPAMILLNPAFFYNSAYWGQIDSIPVFFVMAAVYLLLYSKQMFASSLLFTTALLFKPTALVFLPIYTLAFIKKFGLLPSFKALLLSNIFFIVAFIPFLKSPYNLFEPYALYVNNILNAQSLAFASNSAFNIWSFTLSAPVNASESFLFGLTYHIWGYIFLFMALTLIIKRYINDYDFFSASYLSAFAFFLFSTKMHERYTLLILPFLLLASIKDTLLRKWFYGLSVLSFINLYYSWPVPMVSTMNTLLHLPVVYVTFSMLNMLIFFFLLLRKARH